MTAVLRIAYSGAIDADPLSELWLALAPGPAVDRARAQGECLGWPVARVVRVDRAGAERLPCRVLYPENRPHPVIATACQS